MGTISYLCFMKVNNIKIYFWLIDILLEAGEKGLLLTQIQKRYSQDYDNKVYLRRSFINHRKDILELFGIAIECRASDWRYYIANDASLRHLSRFRTWMYDAVSAMVLSERMMAISDRIVVPHAQGAHHLPDVVTALSQNRKIDILLDTGGIKNFRPYGLCRRNRIWMLAGEVDGSEVFDVSLDEVRQIVVSRSTFIPDSEWNAQKHFRRKRKKQEL